MKNYNVEINELKQFHQVLIAIQTELATELMHLLEADKGVVLLLYSRRCLEVIVRETCSSENIKISDTIPLKGIIDKLNKEKKVPSNIITSMLNLNSSSVYGAHPKEFDSGQVRTALINLASILNWFIDYKGIDTTSQALSQTQSQSLPQTQPQPLTQPQKSIVVLPFANMSSDPEQEYFCDGIAEEIINSLTHISELKVIARTSAFSFKNQNVDVREIGRKLDVNYLLEGSVRKGGNKLRITVQLINLTDGTHLYSERFDRELDDIFEIQDEITLAIVDKLKLKLLNNEKEAVLKKYTDNIEAYNLYLIGRYHNFLLTEEDANKAKLCFESATKIDPSFAPGYAGLGYYYMHQGSAYRSLLADEKVIPLAKKYSLHAVEIDAEYAEAHSILGLIYGAYELDFEKCDYHTGRALELDPMNAEIRRHNATNSFYKGKLVDSLKYIEESIKLDPLMLPAYANASAYHYYSGGFKEAIQYGEKTVQINPNFDWAFLYPGLAYFQLGEKEKAIEFILRSTIYPAVAEPYLGYVYASVGKHEDAQRVLAKINEFYEKKLVSASGVAMVYLGLGDHQKAFDLLKSAINEKPAYSWHTSTIRVEPIWNQVRKHPEFIRIMSKIWKDI